MSYRLFFSAIFFTLVTLSFQNCGNNFNSKSSTSDSNNIIHSAETSNNLYNIPFLINPTLNERPLEKWVAVNWNLIDNAPWRETFSEYNQNLKTNTLREIKIRKNNQTHGLSYTADGKVGILIDSRATKNYSKGSLLPLVLSFDTDTNSEDDIDTGFRLIKNNTLQEIIYSVDLSIPHVSRQNGGNEQIVAYLSFVDKSIMQSFWFGVKIYDPRENELNQTSFSIDSCSTCTQIPIVSVPLLRENDFIEASPLSSLSSTNPFDEQRHFEFKVSWNHLQAIILQMKNSSNQDISEFANRMSNNPNNYRMIHANLNPEVFHGHKGDPNYQKNHASIGLLVSNISVKVQDLSHMQNANNFSRIELPSHDEPDPVTENLSSFIRYFKNSPMAQDHHVLNASSNPPSTFTEEDIVFKAYAQPVTAISTLKKLYSCYSHSLDSHFLSENSNCEGETLIGLLAYISHSPINNMNKALYRCYNNLTNKMGNHLVTTNIKECQDHNYTIEGILGYVN